jgi:hypothetical protein
MPAIGYDFNLLQGLSAFWTRFFADADQLSAMYKGTAVLIGQAYLDYLSTVLGVSLQDCIALDRELYQLLTIREDQVAFVEGSTAPNNRWSFALPSPVVSFVSLDNQVVEPTASLEPNLDFEFGTGGVVLFHADPTNPTGSGVPLNGYARRTVDVDVGGQFTDTTVANWTVTSVAKGDTLRLLDVGTNGLQRRRADAPIVLVRAAGLFTSSASPLPAPATPVNYVVLRAPANNQVASESDSVVGSTLTLGHTRVDQGSLTIFAPNPVGANVVEGVDYTVNYESGVVTVLTAWLHLPGPYGVSYSWREEVFPASGASPRLAMHGSIVAQSTPTVPLTTPALEIAAWAPDARVDRMTLANNFGSLIGYVQPSSESYRAFLRGIFQLYVLGPVLDRLESALNVVMNLPVVNTDGEVYQSTDTSNPTVWRIFTTTPATGQTNTYSFPVNTPLRTDLTTGAVLSAFEVLTTAVTVTDYVQTPSWWYGQGIPKALFGGTVPPIDRRTASPVYVQHVCGPSDGALCGDPGLLCGADEDGFIPSNGQPPLRHRMAYVLMNRYLKFHTFSVSFNAIALSAIANSAAAFAQSLDNLNNLVLSAKPSYTYVFTTPGTFLTDAVEVDEADISFDRLVGSRVFGPDEVIFTDGFPTTGVNGWLAGDYFHYEVFTASTAFPVASTPVTLPDAPTSPRRRRLVKVDMSAGAISGLKLVENVDYTVDYVNCTVTRLTSWTSTTINVTFRQLNIGNTSNAPPTASLGDTYLQTGGIDPALTTAAFNPSAAGWDGTVEGVTAPRDIGMVESPLIITVT